MLQVVYDASPLVRAEVAVSLARVAAGHTLYIQVDPNYPTGLMEP